MHSAFTELLNCNQFQDLIIEAIYADVIHGKLDQQNSQVWSFAWNAAYIYNQPNQLVKTFY